MGTFTPKEKRVFKYRLEETMCWRDYIQMLGFTHEPGWCLRTVMEIIESKSHGLIRSIDEIHWLIFLLKYHWLTVLCLSMLYIKVTHLYTYYIYSFLIVFSIMVYHRILSVVSMLYSKTLLFIHSKCKNLDLTTPNSQSIILPSLCPIDNHKSEIW